MTVFGAELVVFTVFVALVFDFFNGMNDSANSTATVIATRVLRPWQAVVLAAGFNFLGAFVGLEVAKTVGKGIISPSIVTTELILAALVGAIAWTWLCTHYGIPISVSHSLIGGLVGAGLAAAGFGALDLPTLAAIAPALRAMRDGALAGAILGLALGFVAGRRRVVTPALLGAFVGSGVWLAAKIFAHAVVVKGLFATVVFIFYSPMLGFFFGFLLQTAILWLFRRAAPVQMRGWFRWLQVASASFYGLGHGTNDAQKTMGVIAALLIANGWIAPEPFHVPVWVILAAGSAIALGTLIGGYRVVHTMGIKLTRLEPHQGFSAETSSAFGLYFLAKFGVPVSTTHSITGSIMGVGAVRGRHQVAWSVARSIVAAWILTIPASAAVAALSYGVVTLLLGSFA